MTVTYPPELNLARYCLAQAARAKPDKQALIVVADAETGRPSETWTFAELEDAVLRVAAALNDKGLKPGDRLLIRLGNTSTFPILYFGAMAAGIIAVPSSSQLTAEEAEFLLTDCAAHAVALASGLPRGSIPDNVMIFMEDDISALTRHSRRAAYANTAANDPAYLLYTSGTTARPKGVVHAHRVGPGRTPTYQSWYAITPDDRMLHAGAFNWTYTLGTGLIDPWANGATSLIFSGEKTPEIWPALIRSTGATLFAAVPSLIRQILKYAPPGKIDLGGLRHALIAGEKPPEDLFPAWRERTGLELYEALGMSEISTYISSSPTVAVKPGSPGKPQPGRSICILGDGQIGVHTSDPGLMLGYWEEPRVYGEWFETGDAAHIDDDGYVWHHGRVDELMNAGGFRVSPIEVENVLGQHPGILEAGVRELRVSDTNSIISAYVVPQPGARLSEDLILAFAKERLAAYKCPKQITLVHSLPRTANGKLIRKALTT